MQTKFRRHVRAAYRSGLEATVCAALLAAGVAHAYEAVRVPFTQPAKDRHYTPDIILDNGIVVELKGLFVAEDRQKHLWVKAQHPSLDIRLCFSNPNAKTSKGSQTTYGMWASKNGFKFAKKDIPQEWINEPPNRESLKALKGLGWTPKTSTTGKG